MSNQVAAKPRYDNLDLLKAISIFVVSCSKTVVSSGKTEDNGTDTVESEKIDYTADLSTERYDGYNYRIYVRNGFSTLVNDFEFKPYSNGMGAIGLPGDFSSASRFVRALFAKNHASSDSDEIRRVFSILNTVFIPLG